MAFSRLLLLSSVTALVACGVPRPDTDLCIVNIPGQHLTCYNMKKDYDGDGNLLPGHAATLKPIPSLNKYLVIDPTGLGHLKGYLQTIREEQKNCQ